MAVGLSPKGLSRGMPARMLAGLRPAGTLAAQRRSGFKLAFLCLGPHQRASLGKFRRTRTFHCLKPKPAL